MSGLAAAKTLHPRLREEEAVRALAAEWRARGGCLRVEQVLAPGLAEELARAALELPFEAHFQRDEHTSCFFWRCVIEVAVEGGAGLPPPFDRLAAFVLRDLGALLGAIAGRQVQPPTRPWLVLSRFRKGSYLDEHEDHGLGQATAYVLGLTRAAWPAEDGGHLEFLSDDRQTVLERRAPGWDTLDLYDVRPLVRWHRVPLLLRHAERLTVSGWLHAPEERA
ncbi:MAG: 2OG-Fe(II) oxygenase family protein [Planctomycetota bacterium]